MEGGETRQDLLPEPKEPRSSLWKLWTLLKCPFKYNFNRSGTERLNLMHLQASLGATQLDTAEFIQHHEGRCCSNPENTLATLPIDYPTPLRSRYSGQQRLNGWKSQTFFWKKEQHLIYTYQHPGSSSAQHKAIALKLFTGIIGVVLTSLKKSQE